MSSLPPAARARAAAERRARRGAVEDPAVVLEAAAAFLAVRPRSVGETRRRLLDQGYQARLVERVLARLVELGYLDDVAFGQAWLESRDRARPRGETVLRHELLRKGLDRAVVEALLGERSDRLGAGPGGAAADLAAAARLLERRRSALDREPDPQRRRTRAYALLARNGFDPEVCRAVAAAAGARDADESDGAFDAPRSRK